MLRLYAARGVSGEAELDYQLQELPKPELMKGLLSAAEDLAELIIDNNKELMILADFDADGATSCTLLMLGFRALGFTQISYRVPDRFRFGYGLTPEIVDSIAETSGDRLPDVIITVDNGIASVAGVTRAKELGMDVLITDHHLAPEVLPDAWHIINPNQPGCNFPCKSLAGVGVAFYLLLALRTALRERGYFETRAEPNLAEYLDLVALGTVADIVKLEHTNRLLVAQGLKRIRAGRCREAIKSLLALGNRERQYCSATDLGFAVGPRLNAAGRLDDMSLGIEALLEDDPARALQLSERLDELNKARRSIESDMQDQALAVLNEQFDNLQSTDKFGLCLYREDWHQGVVGLLASRIKERVYRPVIAFAPTEPGSDELKGSARSIPGVHIRDLLDSIATRYPEVLSKFGGHAMAAGLSLKRQHFKRFSEYFDESIKELLDGRHPEDEIITDGPLGDHEMTLESAREIEFGGPWGQGFEEPLFDGVFTVLNRRNLGDKHLKLSLATEQGSSIQAIAFFVDEKILSQSFQRCQITYRLSVNRYLDRESVQLIINHLLPLSS